MYTFENFQQEVKKALEKASGIKIDDSMLSIPPDSKLGDLSTTIAFTLAKKQKKNPKQIAEQLSKKIQASGLIKEIKTAGPYINFYLNNEKFSEQVLQEALKEEYGSGEIGKGKQVMIEYCGVNPNKAHHVGHFRNESIGQVLANVHKYLGYDVITASIVNDKGVPVAKTMLGYEMWGQGKPPDIKADHYAGKWYSMFEAELEKKPELKEKAQEVVQKIQSNDPEAIKTWKKVWDWFFDGMNQTHVRENVHIDKFYLESELQEKGKEIVKQGLEKGVFKEEKGAIVSPLEQFNLPDKVLLRSDGTAVYATTDLGMVYARFTEYPKLVKNIYCVMNEQTTYFKQWMNSFELLYPEYKGKSYHLAYGMVHLKEGGKMSSRKGKGTLSDDLMDEIAKLASQTTKKNNPSLSEKEIQDIGEMIGVGALKFSILSIESHKDIYFDKEKAVSFEGDTGPYLQYAHARCTRILEKVGKIDSADYKALKKDQEIKLIKKISEFPLVVKKIGKNYEVHSISNYLLELVHSFSSFYENCPVIKAESEALKAARAQLVEATQNTLKIGLDLLGIKAPERM